MIQIAAYVRQGVAFSRATFRRTSTRRELLKKGKAESHPDAEGGVVILSNKGDTTRQLLDIRQGVDLEVNMWKGEGENRGGDTGTHGNGADIEVPATASVYGYRVVEEGGHTCDVSRCYIHPHGRHVESPQSPRITD